MGAAYYYQNRKPVTPATATIAWNVGATAYSLVDQGDGTFAGDGSGTIDYATGHVELQPNPAPGVADGGFNVSFNEWDSSQSTQLTHTETPINGSLSASLPSGNIKPTSFVIRAVMLQHPKVITSAGRASAAGEKVQEDVVIRDDGNGNLKRYGAGADGTAAGTINYTTGDYTLDARANYKHLENIKDGYYYVLDTQTSLDEYDLTVDLQMTWVASADADALITKTVNTGGLSVSLLPGVWRPILPGSLLFTFGGKTYRDRDGAILTDWSSTTDSATNVGSIDYQTGYVTLDSYPSGVNSQTAPAILACATTYGERLTGYSQFRTSGSPLRQGSFIINAISYDGEQISAQADTDGSITHASITAGKVDTETGIVSIEWAVPVFPSSVKYSAVAYSYLPLDPELLGLDPTRLPSDGRVPIFLPGDVGVISHTIDTEVASPVAGETLTFSRDHQAEVWVTDANGLYLPSTQFTLDRVAGSVTWANPLTLQDENLNDLTLPLTVHDRVEDMVLITDVQVSGQVSFNAQLSQDYPAGEAILSSAVLHGDLRARVYNLFHQSSWTSVWSDSRIGSDTTAKYNDVAYPIEITNQGSIQERWRIAFTSSTAFQVVGETVGVVGTGNITEDCAIANPATGAPYFTIRADGWGTGWATNNQLRFNTDGSQSPFWVARTILSGPATAEEDSFATQNRGDAD